eukprot:6673319-Alexandrium_andersonii.AAC.1
MTQAHRISRTGVKTKSAGSLQLCRGRTRPTSTQISRKSLSASATAPAPGRDISRAPCDVELAANKLT